MLEGGDQDGVSGGQGVGGTPKDAGPEERRFLVSFLEANEQGRAVSPVVAQLGKASQPSGVALMLCTDPGTG